MSNAASADVGRTARLVVLLCTLIGLTAMHSLGHAGPASTGMSSAPDRAVVAAMDPCADDGCQHLAATTGHSHSGMPGWDICVAVLVAIAVLLAATARRSARLRSAPSVTGRRTLAGPAPRGPPRPVGLRIATVSVLRT